MLKTALLKILAHQTCVQFIRLRLRNLFIGKPNWLTAYRI